MDKKVSELIEANELSDEDLFMILQNNQNKKIKALTAFKNLPKKTDIEDLISAIEDLESKIAELQKPKRVELFNNSNNQSKTIDLVDSAYNYSYLYIHNAANYNAIVPIYAEDQTNLRGIGGFSGPENTGSTHFYGTISNEGKTINVEYFKSIAHNSAGNHSSSSDRNVFLVVGIR